ncbi:RHS repeat domain-containing protein [Lachnoanaerobaculum orale]|uniref:RHS repeat domain-containing protein n=1 Tax=Lachnoanaerobaculum orale TaxID=979627 RepID=UPI001FA9AF45|nr:RHS repeat-associated core domain-containing protein [Lachnoanaerobaculum orale]
MEYTYNSLRQLSQVKDALGTINIESDKFGRATKVVDYTGDEVSYRYGKYGERLKTVYPDGKSVSYEYDEYLRLTSLTSGNKRVDYTYDKEGRLIRKDMSDEVSSIYKYNERGLLSSLRHLKENRKVEEYTYDYDLLGNKTKIVRHRDVNSKGIKENDNKEKIIHKLWDDSSTFYYSYDALSRLIEVKRGDRLVSKYTYDAYGNRESLKSGNDLEIRYTYDALDRLIKEGGLQGNKTYEYDKSGNLIGITERGKRVRAYEYDITGRLGLSYSKSGKARSYSYDGLGNRIGFKEYEKQIGYGEDGLKSILEENLSELTPSYEESYILDRTKAYHNLLQNKTIKRGSQAIQSYIWDFNVAYMEEGEKEFTYLQDELGSTIRLLEQGGESQAVYGYDEFGEDTYNTQGKMQPFGYTGYRYDNVADTYFAQAREYVPGVGRFAGEDWIKGSIEQPFSLNQYGYCFGNPEKFVDLDGKVPTILIGAGIGAVFGFAGGLFSEVMEIEKGNQKDINWNNVIVDTTSGLAVGAIAGTGVGIGYLVAGGMLVGGGNYATKVAANGEFKSKSLQEHFVDGAISSVVWGISAAAGGTMQKEVQELKEISKIIDNGLYNIALAKAVQGGAYMGDAPGENMVDVGKWQYTDFVQKMILASLKTNGLATVKSTLADILLKFTKDKVYKKQNNNMSDEELREKFERYINRSTKVGKCFAE